jgi:hypothetical protein
MKKEEPRMITAKEYAEMHEVHYTTVMNWLRRDLLPGAIKEDLPFGGYFYKIPIETPIPNLKPGPKPLSEEEKVVRAEGSELGKAQSKKVTKKSRKTRNTSKKR